MKELLTWPVTLAAALLIFGLAFIVLFRAQIASLLLRMKRAGKDGIDFDRGASAQPNQPEQPTLSYEELIQKPVSETVRFRESLITRELESYNPKDDKQKITLLLRSLSIQMVNADFARIQYTIFGSQMNLMGSLVSRNQPMPMSEAEDAFAEAKAAHPEFYENTDAQGWLSFLSHNGLIEITSEKIDLTQIGKDFLKYLIDTRSAIRRPF